MLQWIVIFAILSVIAGVLGFGGLASTFAWIAQIQFFIFLAVMVILGLAIIGIFKKVKRS